MNIKPVGNKILVKKLKSREVQLDSTIIMPENINADLAEGEIVAASDELKGKYDVGDVILFAAKAGKGQIEGKEYYLWLDASPSREEVWGKLLN
jgi:co-chaperonin GroES (HSP10)